MALSQRHVARARRRTHMFDITTLAAWGEFIGGIGGLVAALAVIASLVFVGVQIRSSVRQANIDSYTGVTELWTNFTASTAASELAIPMARLWWPWKPISVDGLSSARASATRAVTSSGSIWPAESVM